MKLSSLSVHHHQPVCIWLYPSSGVNFGTALQGVGVCTQKCQLCFKQTLLVKSVHFESGQKLLWKCKTFEKVLEEHKAALQWEAFKMKTIGIWCYGAIPSGKSKGSTRAASSIGRRRNKQGKHRGLSLGKVNQTNPVPAGASVAGLEAEPSRFHTSGNRESCATSNPVCLLRAVIVTLVIG